MSLDVLFKYVPVEQHRLLGIQMGSITQNSSQPTASADAGSAGASVDAHDFTDLILRGDAPRAGEFYCPQCHSLRTSQDAQCEDCHAQPPPQGWPSLAECDDPWLGRIIDGLYLLDRRIGEGSVGVIYRAVSQKLSRAFALKIVDPTSEVVVDVEREQMLRNLRREIRAQSSFKNPHVVHLFDVMTLPGGQIGILMDLVDGRTVYKLVREHGPLPVERALVLLRQACIGVHEAHEAGLIHRDLKPQNLMLETLPSGEDFVRVLDFGIVCLQNEAEPRRGFVGTPSYASPEQAACARLDRRSDVYSLGVVLYFMLVGESPFTGASVADVLSAQISEVPPPMSQASTSRDFDPKLEELVERLLAKEPNERPDSLSQLITEIDALLSLSSVPSAPLANGSNSQQERSEVDTVEIVVDDPSSQPGARALADSGLEWPEGLEARTLTIPTSVIDRAWALTGDERIVYLHECGDLKLVDSELETEWALDLGLDERPATVTLADDVALVGTNDGHFHEYSLSFDHRCLLWVTPGADGAVCAGSDAKARRLAIVTETGKVYLGYRSATNTIGWYPLDVGARVVDVAVARSGNRLAVNTRTGDIQVWDLGQPAEHLCSVNIPSGARSMVLDDDASHLVCLTNAGDCGVLDLPSGGWESICSNVDGLRGVDIDPNGRLLLLQVGTS